MSSPTVSETTSELDATSSELVGAGVVLELVELLLDVVSEVVSGSVVVGPGGVTGVTGVTGGGLTGAGVVCVGVVVVLVVDVSAGGVCVTGGGVTLVVEEDESTALVLIPGEVPSLEQLAKASTPSAPSATPRALRKLRWARKLERFEREPERFEWGPEDWVGRMTDTCSVSVVVAQGNAPCIITAEHGTSRGVFQKPAIPLYECGFPVSV